MPAVLEALSQTLHRDFPGVSRLWACYFAEAIAVQQRTVFNAHLKLGEAACSSSVATRAGATSTSMLHQQWQSRLLHSKEDEDSLSGCEGASKLI